MCNYIHNGMTLTFMHNDGKFCLLCVCWFEYARLQYRMSSLHVPHGNICNVLPRIAVLNTTTA